MNKIRSLFTPRDMSQGEPWKRIAEFAFPLLIGNFAQQLYNTVDAVVVGNSKWGYTALASVGNAGPVLNLLLALFVGISTGAGILVAQYFGAKDTKSLTKTIGNCITLTAIASLVIMIVGPLITGPLLTAVNTLPSMFDACKAYLDIFFYGIAGFFFYNIFAGVLRGLGDSFSALLYLLVTSALNIVLDLLLVDSMGVAGVALATIIAQFISAFLCLRKLLSLKNIFTLTKEDLRPDGVFMHRIVALGIPSGVTQAIFSCAMMVVQRLINGFNDEMFVACNVMVMRVDGYAMLPNFSFGQAMGTFAGQNVGARRLDRLKDGTRQGLIMSLVTSLVLTPLILLFGPALMRLFTPEQSLIDLSMGMMYILAAGYVAMSVTQVLQGVIRGAGDTVTPMWISLLTTVLLRLPVAYGLVYLTQKAGASLLVQEQMVFVSLLVTWLLGMVITIVVYKVGKWKENLGAHLEEK
ncbi:MAG: MATE family efflux transporter [Lachnospiraceae bacterium]|nr:MATE family efflux transporter [Lachnospiraceae bacterium]MBR4210122.1 MATE family efflux transporter [Lachnospiraceae bacterium]